MYLSKDRRSSHPATPAQRQQCDRLYFKARMWMLLFAQLQSKIEDNVSKINPNVNLNALKYCCFSIIHY